MDNDSNRTARLAYLDHWLSHRVSHTTTQVFTTGKSLYQAYRAENQHIKTLSYILFLSHLKAKYSHEYKMKLGRGFTNIILTQQN